MNDMPTALARWDDEGGSVAPRPDSSPLPKAAPPLGLYQRASLRRSYGAGFAVSASPGLFCEPRDSSDAADGIRRPVGPLG